ncbi:hypothetical protein Shyhy02_61810 [Streptomyces hygroscopicus subsp. hygroscopicus]|nr:hypothetical protein Shyhy02_61810 [Streptomyces hygroscopicus subsp. hygroscopicus]
MPSIIRDAVVAGRAHAAEPHIDTAPRPFGAEPSPRGSGAKPQLWEGAGRGKGCRRRA